jgi:hypothetical protein
LPGSHKQNPFGTGCSLVNGSLERSAVVARAVGVSAEIGSSQINRFGVIQARGDRRSRESGSDALQQHDEQ